MGLNGFDFLQLEFNVNDSVKLILKKNSLANS